MTGPERPSPSPSARPSAPPPEEMEDLDPGFARQRTELAWTRTALSFGGLGAATLKAVPVAGALIIAIAIVVWLVGRLSLPYGPTEGRARGRLMLMVTVAIVGVSLIALVATSFAGAGPLGNSTG